MFGLNDLGARRACRACFKERRACTDSEQEARKCNLKEEAGCTELAGARSRNGADIGTATSRRGAPALLPAGV